MKDFEKQVKKSIRRAEKIRKRTTRESRGNYRKSNKIFLKILE